MSDPADEDQSEKQLLALAGLLASTDIVSPRENDHFRQVVEALPAAIYITDAEGVITYYNDAAAQLWGWRPKLGQNQWCGSWKLFWPDGRTLPHNQCPMAMALREGQPNRGMEAIAERPDGTRVPSYPIPRSSMTHLALSSVP